MDELKNIIESLLFVSEEPLTVDQVRKVVQHSDARTVREALNALSAHYEERGGGFFLAEVAGGFQLRTRPEYNEYIKGLLQPKPPRLSKAALETLAIIAYKQPIIRADLEHLRGVDSGGVLRLLLKRKLIRVLGRKEIPGRPLIYATTKRFLEVFDLKDLKDLPTPREIEELGSEASDELAAAFEALSLPDQGPVRPGEERSLFDRAPEDKDGQAAEEGNTETKTADSPMPPENGAGDGAAVEADSAPEAEPPAVHEEQGLDENDEISDDYDRLPEKSETGTAEDPDPDEDDAEPESRF